MSCPPTETSNVILRLEKSYMKNCMLAIVCLSRYMVENISGFWKIWGVAALKLKIPAQAADYECIYLVINVVKIMSGFW